MAKKSSKQIDLEHDYERALGQLTRYFALLHYALEHIAWSIWNLHNEFGKILTKDLPTKHLSEKLLASLKVMDVDQKQASELQTILRTVEKLAQERNNLVHALWIIEDGKPVELYRRRAGIKTAPSPGNIHALNNSILTVAEQLQDWEEHHRSILINAMDKKRAAKAKGISGANTAPKHHDTP